MRDARVKQTSKGLAHVRAASDWPCDFSEGDPARPYRAGSGLFSCLARRSPVCNRRPVETDSCSALPGIGLANTRIRRDLRTRRHRRRPSSMTRKCWTSAAGRPRAPIRDVGVHRFVGARRGRIVARLPRDLALGGADPLTLFGAPRPSRVCTHGNGITGGGVTAGIDFALTVVASLSVPGPRR